ncbi:hypothetical protein ABIA19_000949 [Sinorhizobium fredii]
MSALFFKVSWAHTIEKYRELRRASKRLGWELAVRNVSRTRGIPLFLFCLDRKDGSQPHSFSCLDEVRTELAKVGDAA